MRQTTKDNTKKTEKRFSEHLHESLVAHRIITKPRVVKFGTYYSYVPHNSPEVIHNVNHTIQIETAPRELRSI